MALLERSAGIVSVVNALQAADEADQARAYTQEQQKRLFEELGVPTYSQAGHAIDIFPRIYSHSTRLQGLGGRTIGFREVPIVLRASVKATIQQGDTTAEVWVANEPAAPRDQAAKMRSGELAVVGQLSGSDAERVLYRLGPEGDIRTLDGQHLDPESYSSVGAIVGAIDAAAEAGLQEYRAGIISLAQELVTNHGRRTRGNIIATPRVADPDRTLLTHWLTQRMARIGAPSNPIHVMITRRASNVPNPEPEIGGILRDGELFYQEFGGRGETPGHHSTYEMLEQTLDGLRSAYTGEPRQKRTPSIAEKVRGYF